MESQRNGKSQPALTLGSAHITSSAYPKSPRRVVLPQAASLKQCGASNPSHYLIQGSCSNYPGNQLRDGQISLSPLYPSQADDLNVSGAMKLELPLTVTPFSQIFHHRCAHPQRSPKCQLAVSARSSTLTFVMLSILDHICKCLRLLGPCFTTS